MERELPKPGDHWRHFKGGEYAIVAIARQFHGDSEFSTW